MENDIYKIKIMHDKHLGQSDYVQGRISGIMLAMCGLDENGQITPSTFLATDVYYDAGLTVLKVRASDSTKFWKCCELIEELYPGLCIFG